MGFLGYTLTSSKTHLGEEHFETSRTAVLAFAAARSDGNAPPAGLARIDPTDRCEVSWRARLALGRPLPRRSCSARDRGARPALRFLFGQRGRRCLEDERRRAHLEPHLRFAADRFHWRDGRGAFRTQHYLCGRGRGRYALLDFLRKRHVKVRRR